MYIWRFLSFFYGKLTTQLGGGMFYPNHLYSARDLAGKSKEPKVQCTRAPSLFVSTISKEYKRTNYITITTQMQLTLIHPKIFSNLLPVIMAGYLVWELNIKIKLKDLKICPNYSILNNSCNEYINYTTFSFLFFTST